MQCSAIDWIVGFSVFNSGGLSWIRFRIYRILPSSTDLGRRWAITTICLLIATSLLLIISPIQLHSRILVSSSAQSVGIGLWTSGSPFPAGNVEVGASGANDGILYYVGGQLQPSGHYTNAVYFASILSNGSIGKWTMSARPYPGAKGIWALQCPPYNGFVYCIGGNKVPGGTTNAVYYATVSTAGLGSWKSTTSYPLSIRFDSCVPYNGYMYCIGGSPNANSATKDVYYAQILTQGGLGKWTSTTSYPITTWAHCVADFGYLFCLSDYNGNAITNLTYYAQLSSAGVGAWKSGPNYPITKEKMQCVLSNNSIFCIGGGNGIGGKDGNQGVDNVFTAALSTSGFGSWQSTTSYPITIKDHSCSSSGGYIYCIGGDDPRTTNAAYFTRVV